MRKRENERDRFFGTVTSDPEGERSVDREDASKIHCLGRTAVSLTLNLDSRTQISGIWPGLLSIEMLQNCIERDLRDATRLFGIDVFIPLYFLSQC